jgi:acetyl-CoA carboxylase biotin carboxyl carrier protein
MTNRKLLSEITGKVWKIISRPGDQLAEGDTIMVFESMKMEIPLIADMNGILREILVIEGQQISEGEPVAILGY